MPHSCSYARATSDNEIKNQFTSWTTVYNVALVLTLNTRTSGRAEKIGLHVNTTAYSSDDAGNVGADDEYIWFFAGLLFLNRFPLRFRPWRRSCVLWHLRRFRCQPKEVAPSFNFTLTPCLTTHSGRVSKLDEACFVCQWPSPILLSIYTLHTLIHVPLD